MIFLFYLCTPSVCTLEMVSHAVFVFILHINYFYYYFFLITYSVCFFFWHIIGWKVCMYDWTNNKPILLLKLLFAFFFWKINEEFSRIFFLTVLLLFFTLLFKLLLKAKPCFCLVYSFIHSFIDWHNNWFLFKWLFKRRNILFIALLKLYFNYSIYTHVRFS